MTPGLAVLRLHRFTAQALRRAPHVGELAAISWRDLARAAERPIVAEHKAAFGGFCFADLGDGIRRLDHIITTSAIVIDHDGGTVPLARAHALLARTRHVVHTTASNTPEAPRWRAYLGVSRPMTPAEHRIVYAHVLALMAGAEVPLDRGCADPSRLWYLPTIPHEGAPHEHASAIEATPLDVDAIVQAEARKREGEHRQITDRLRQRDRDERRHGAYQKAALELAGRAVLDAAIGERHYSLGREAFALARDELHLDASDIHAALMGAWVHAAGPSREREGARTIADAIRARRGAA